ncbi:hypothetical protein [Staphylococcus pseudintermedius]|uniref:hypothetical protein n=1 Tax=Staphylococcus pseudintermedius TaxID=283734 RepID=UPI0028FD38BF|nr:hypothetical protein [Staphylococcus pseudintermedius]MDU0384091.1 hypothetical protein [Staphylococcus pseudintermedius]
MKLVIIDYVEFKRLVEQEVRLKDKIVELEDETIDFNNLVSDEQHEITHLQLAKIASYLNKVLTYSDINASVNLQKYGSASSVNFTHFDDRYKSNAHTAFIHPFESGFQVNKKLRIIKDVISGEALLDEQSI